MAVELLANLAASTLAADITTTGATTLTVASAASFPAAVTGTSQFRVIVGTELMIVTNVSGTTFTVTRGAEGTTAATHTTGDAITHVVTAATLAEIGVPAGAGGAGKVLTSGSADYAQAWTTPGYGGGDIFRPGYYSIPLASPAAYQSAAGVVGVCFFVPMNVPVLRSFDRIGVNVTAGGTTGALLRMGIYSGAGRPTTLILDAGTVDSTTTGAKEIVISASLGPGVIWLAMATQVAACSTTTYPILNASPLVPSSTTPPTTASGVGVWYQTGVTGALPSSPTLAGTTYGPVISLRAA